MRRSNSGSCVRSSFERKCAKPGIFVDVVGRSPADRGRFVKSITAAADFGSIRATRYLTVNASSPPPCCGRFVPSQSDVAYSDTPLGGHVIDDIRDVAELARLFASLQARALPEDRSADLLRSIAREHH
ncbi:Scr1 family TA system antitoxin-like transcriptional regulator [Saccharopolyspora sp. 5N708]|uniref:Scr1 family TA system antitoxin-like transcriptional regulator n=1 Tax=Saccharopolyspora sp. 5N708 TaxID=3457424 RepID=UPI003FD367C6